MSRTSGLCRPCWLHDRREASFKLDGERAHVQLWVDNETYDAVMARARRERTGLGEQLRLLIEWGLEADR